MGLLSVPLKTCSKCSIEKETSEFSPDKTRKDGFYPYCKACKRITWYAWVANNPEKFKEQNRRGHLRRTYNLTLEEYDAFGKLCEICGREERKNSLHVDHDHVTQRNRGKLCGVCNMIVGLIEEDPDFIQKVQQYIDERVKN